jgi:uncharacterized protein (TIGR03067 family)
VASEVGGRKTAADDLKLKMWKVIFDGDKVSIPDHDRAPYSLDLTKRPREMDIIVGGKISPMKLIYEFDGERLKLSLRKGGERPADFDTTKHKDSVLIVFERRKAP